MKRMMLLVVLLVFNAGLLMGCDDPARKKPGARGESDWSASSMVKDIEEMNKQSKGPAKEAPGSTAK